MGEILDFNAKKRVRHTLKEYEKDMIRFNDCSAMINELVNSTNYAEKAQIVSFKLKKDIHVKYKNLLKAIASAKYSKEENIDRVFDIAVEDLEDLLDSTPSEEEIMTLSLEEIKEFK